MRKFRPTAPLAFLLFLGMVGHLTAQPGSDAGSGGMSPGVMGQGMMGQMMGPGMMGPDMMRGPAASVPGRDTTGTALFRGQCAACHTLETGGESAIGPNLHHLFGRRAGRLPGYSYSPAMRRSGVVWGEKTLDGFLADPSRFVPGNKMPFAGIRDERQRQALIA